MTEIIYVLIVISQIGGNSVNVIGEYEDKQTCKISSQTIEAYDHRLKAFCILGEKND